MTILGVFGTAEQATRAVTAIRGADLGAVTTYSPTADHTLLAAHRKSVSPVRMFTLIGGLLGCAVGIGLPVYTMLDWPLMVGGKPLVSIPPLVIIAFELSMLGAALGGFAGFLLSAGLPRMGARTNGEHRFTDDEFGVIVSCADDHRGAVREHLTKAGASEVTDRG